MFSCHITKYNAASMSLNNILISINRHSALQNQAIKLTKNVKLKMHSKYFAIVDPQSTDIFLNDGI